MSPAPFFHGWSSGYLRPAFLGWEGQEALAPRMDTGASRIVHTGLVPPEIANARCNALFIQPGHVPGIVHRAGGYTASLDTACSKAVSIGRAPMKTACDKKVFKTSSTSGAAPRSVRDEMGAAVCTKGSSPSKSVSLSSEPFRVTR